MVTHLAVEIARHDPVSPRNRRLPRGEGRVAILAQPGFRGVFPIPWNRRKAPADTGGLERQPAQTQRLSDASDGEWNRAPDSPADARGVNELAHRHVCEY